MTDCNHPIILPSLLSIGRCAFCNKLITREDVEIVIINCVPKYKLKEVNETENMA